MRSLITTTLEDSRPFPDRNLSTMVLLSQQPNLSLGGAELLNLLPGFYELQIMAVSLAGNSSWTPPLLFEVTTSPVGVFSYQNFLFLCPHHFGYLNDFVFQTR